MAYVSTTQRTRKSVDVSVLSQPIALDGISTRQFLFVAEVIMAVRLIRVCYIEATTSHTGVGLHIGKIGHPRYFASFTSATSQSIGTVATVTKFPNNINLAAGETLTVDCDGGKSGLGLAVIQVELEGYR